MKIINKTIYETKDLRKIITESFKRNCKIEGSLRNYQKTLKIEISYGNYTGYAYIAGTYMKLRIPKLSKFYNKEPNTFVDSAYFAWLFVHELYHIRGYKHRRLGKNIMYFSQTNGEFNWAKEYKIGMKQKKLKQDIQLVRYERIVKMLEDKNKKLKRLQNQIKKWNAKKKYYERTLTAAGKLIKK